MSAIVRLASGRYMLAVARGERPEPPEPYAYDLGRWVFVEGPEGQTCRLELTNDEEREVADWLSERAKRRAA